MSGARPAGGPVKCLRVSPLESSPFEQNFEVKWNLQEVFLLALILTNQSYQFMPFIMIKHLSLLRLLLSVVVASVDRDFLDLPFADRLSIDMLSERMAIQDIVSVDAPSVVGFVGFAANLAGEAQTLHSSIMLLLSLLLLYEIYKRVAVLVRIIMFRNPPIDDR